MRSTTIEFRKGEADPPAIIAALADAPDGAAVKVDVYLNGDIRRIRYTTEENTRHAK